MFFVHVIEGFWVVYVFSLIATLINKWSLVNVFVIKDIIVMCSYGQQLDDFALNFISPFYWEELMILYFGVRFCLLYYYCYTLSFSICVYGHSRNVRLFLFSMISYGHVEYILPVIVSLLLFLCSGDIHPNPGPERLFTFISANVQSIMGRRKLPMVIAEFYSKDVDLYMFCETWLTSDVMDQEFCKDGYEVFRKDRGSSGRGGVLILAKFSLHFQEIFLPNIMSEIIVIANSDIMVVNFYRPDSVKDLFIHDMRMILNWHQVNMPNHKLLVVGDINLPSLKCWETGLIIPGKPDTGLSRKFLTLTQEFMLTQKVQNPTRGENILDIALVNFPDSLKVETKPGVSDHDCICGEYLTQVNSKIENVQLHKVILWRQANWALIRAFVSDKLRDFKSFLDEAGVEEAWKFFHSCLLQAFCDVPYKFTGVRKDAPFVSLHVKRKIRKRNRLYKKARKTGFESDWISYVQFAKETKNLVRKTKECFYKKLLDDNMEFDTRRFYKLVNSKRCDKIGVSDLCIGSDTIRDSSGKAEILSRTFGEVFQLEDLSIPFPRKEVSSYPDMPNFIISESGVKRLLESQKINKAAGSDGLSPILIKNLATEIAGPLTLLYRRSYESGVCPIAWRSAFVCPVYKGRGKRSDPSMYRPISLTPVCSKIFEHIFVSNLMMFVESQKILIDEQYGFRKGRSCELQLLLFVDDILSNYEKGNQIDAVFLDMSRAFDKVPHRRLLEKLNFYGIRGRHLYWIESFLSHRYQRVVVNGFKSSAVHVTSGVPQGSVLGPFLFLLYINDLVDAINKNVCSIRLFADDCVVYAKINSEECVSEFQNCINSINGWADKWMMNFNAGKSALMRFSRKRKKIQSTYLLNNTLVPVQEEYKYLGVNLTDNLKWDRHIDVIISKASRSLGFFKRNLKGCSKKVRCRVYETIIRPQVEYCSALWGPYKRQYAEESCLDKRLEQVQRRAARWVMGDYRMSSSVTEMVRKLNWKTLAERRRLDRLVCMYKIVHGYVAVSDGYICKKSECGYRGGRDSHQLSLVVPHSSLYIRKGSFFIRAVEEWNKVDTVVLMSDSVKRFRDGLTAGIT